MPRKRKVTSRRGRKEIDDLFLKSFEATKKAITRINKRLESGEGLSDEQFRFLKKTPQLIAVYKAREEAKDERRDVLPEGKLKEYQEQLWALQDEYRKAVGNSKAVLDKEAYNKVIEAVGLYRCPKCGELHSKGQECMFTMFLEESVHIDQYQPD